MSYTKFKNSHTFYCGIRIVEKDQRITFVDEDKNIIPKLTRDFNHFYQGFVIHFCCDYQTLILEKDGVLYATNINHLDESVCLNEIGDVSHFIDAANGCFALVFGDSKSIVFKGTQPNSNHHEFCGRVRLFAKTVVVTSDSEMSVFDYNGQRIS